MYELLTSSNATVFLDKFVNLYDGVVRGIEINYSLEQVRIIISVQQQQLDDYSWVNLELKAEKFVKFNITQGNYCCDVLSDGLQIGFFDNYIYLDLCPSGDVPESKEQFEKSHLLIVSESCSWRVLPYSEQMNIKET